MPSISVTVPALPSSIGLGSSSILSHTIRIPTLTEESLHTNDFGAFSGSTEYVSPMHDLNDTVFYGCDSLDYWGSLEQNFPACFVEGDSVCVWIRSKANFLPNVSLRRISTFASAKYSTSIEG
mgnify:CR=1 FL=1